MYNFSVDELKIHTNQVNGFTLRALLLKIVEMQWAILRIKKVIAYISLGQIYKRSHLKNIFLENVPLTVRERKTKQHFCTAFTTQKSIKYIIFIFIIKSKVNELFLIKKREIVAPITIYKTSLPL
jgi:hypothetical protein